MAVRKNPTELDTAAPFSDLFPVDPRVLASVTAAMRRTGYDPHHPMLAWRDAFGEHGRTVVIDGHTRRRAAIDAGVREVWVTVRRFPDADAAIAAAVEEQAHRRNLTSAQLAVYVLEALGRLDDGTRGQGARNDLYGRSARQLADMLGVGTSTIERARKLLDYADSDLLDEVKRGELSLKAAVERGRRVDREEVAPPVKAPPVVEPDEPNEEDDAEPEEEEQAPAPEEIAAAGKRIRADRERIRRETDVDITEPAPEKLGNKFSFAAWARQIDARAYEAVKALTEYEDTCDHNAAMRGLWHLHAVYGEAAHAATTLEDRLVRAIAGLDGDDGEGE